ncbi:MAG TPA: ATP synthase F0 subunit B [Thermoanaerobaculia bacterium]|nr:ATP synthase F0 subunit B [Thermoanaerobaculia bacterium]
MKFDASLLVVVAIFGVAYFLLKVFLFDRLLRILQARERRVEDARSTWQRATAEVEEALTAERQRLIAARREATARREALRREALDLRGTMLGEADAAAKRMLEQATAELQSERAREEQTLAGRAAALAARISERLVGRAV